MRDPLANAEALIPRVYAYVAYRIGAGPDAEDVTSETFERALRYRERYDPRKGPAIAWLIGIARNLIGDLPGQEAPLAAERLETPSTEPGIEADAVRRLTLVAAVRALPERDRELIALRYGADLTARQIGRQLGMSTNAVEVALHRALARLRIELEPGQAGEASTPAPRLAEAL